MTEKCISHSKIDVKAHTGRNIHIYIYISVFIIRKFRRMHMHDHKKAVLMHNTIYFNCTYKQYIPVQRFKNRHPSSQLGLKIFKEFFISVSTLSSYNQRNTFLSRIYN